MSTVLLIDLSSVAHPLWHTSGSDADTDATSNKTVARIHALAAGQPHVAICCDSGRSFRRDISADYKAQREAAPAALTHQINRAMELLAGDGFPVWSVKGFEADDLIASAAALLLADGKSDVDEDATRVLIASADKDLLQLIGPRVRVKRLTDGNVWDEATVMQMLGVRPNQMLDYLALVGDTSDNVKGADGIGAKKASALLKKYGTLEDLYADLKAHGTNFTPALATSLKEFEPRMAQVRSLIALRVDVPLPIAEVFRDRVPADSGIHYEDEGASSMEGLPADPAGPSEAGKPGVAASQEPPQGGQPAPEGQSVAGAASEAQPAAQPVVMRPQPRTVEPMVAPPAAETGMTVAFEQALEPRDFRQVSWLAEQMYRAKLFSAYGTPQAVMATILAGRELGLNAMASLRAFHIIEGKPSLAADLIRALVLRSGKAEYFKCTERSADAATFKTKRTGDEEVILRFTIEEGRAAFSGNDDKWEKSGWGKNPADMCVARAGAKLARLVYPDVVHGFYAPEELEN